MAIFSESGSFLNLYREIIPMMGPGNKIVKLYDHPTTLTKTGRILIDNKVKMNPTAVCNVSAVPTYAGDTSSAIMDEYCGESGITVIPQNMAINNAIMGLSNDSPITRELTPLKANMIMLNVVLP